ncbi:CheR family methyltransferase [Algoriphagus namhaensis]|uniref:CheR family methyltransferase n=1 Tax=Algoriphagus namhaensis TaxID=915353 RepID=A0ABV8AV47_9BACT
MSIEDYIADLDQRFFQNQLSAPFKTELKQLPLDRKDVLEFVERTFRFMHMGKVSAKDISLITAQALGTLMARILPGGWEGKVPPVTLPGRHIAMDELLKNSEFGQKENVDMLDIGCGFPPYTTLDTAKLFPNWNITGVDPSLPLYLLYDDQGNYATLDENKQTVYFQPALPSLENWNELLSDYEGTKRRFEALLEELLQNPTTCRYALPRVEINPILQHETAKLRFKNGGIGQVDIEPQDVIRCFNVLIYFDNPFFERALSWFSDHLKEGGMLLIGANWTGSSESYYSIYRKLKGKLIKSEFAFSLDCIAPFAIIPWYANHDDDAQTKELMDYVSRIRSDDAFMQEFYALHDADRKRLNICARDENGYYGGPDPNMGPHAMWGGIVSLLQGLNDAGLNTKAAEVLKASGLNVTVNAVGHVSVAF